MYGLVEFTDDMNKGEEWGTRIYWVLRKGGGVE